ncbi:MAG: CAP domain-containing protein [Chloroflexota bacterium]|nr:CAP domain-containing protein [Chloroflexota bacterium]MDQ5866342.1 CAP domain-containing protein [Chloroflexota bacterium]
MQATIHNTPNNAKAFTARTRFLRTAGAALLAGAMLLQPLAFATATTVRTSQVLPAVGAPVASQYFSPTGKSVQGTFLSTFNRYGLERIGYPLSDERVENGQVVQYFERVRMEFHPEVSSSPVLFSRLGAEMTEGVQFAKVAPFKSTRTRAYFPATGHSLGGGFYTYWQQNGGLALFGLPLSEEFKENGLTVQWFERARFEYHPQLVGTRNAIQLSHLGSIAYSSQANRTTSAPAPAPAPAVVNAPTVQEAPASVSLSGPESYVLQAINEQRAAAGVAPVKLQATVTEISRSRSNDMAARNYFSHTSPEGKQFLGMLGDYKVSYKVAGEILARNNYPEAEAGRVAVEGYMGSPAHKAILIDPRFTLVGVGHAVDAAGMNYYTVIFVQQ